MWSVMVSMADQAGFQLVEGKLRIPWVKKNNNNTTKKTTHNYVWKAFSCAALHWWLQQLEPSTASSSTAHDSFINDWEGRLLCVHCFDFTDTSARRFVYCFLQ